MIKLPKIRRNQLPVIGYPFFLLWIVSAPIQALAQEAENEQGERGLRHHRLSIGLGHAHIPAGVWDGEKEWLNLGAFTFDYDYSFSRKWSLGIHTDIVPTGFEVESDDEEEIIKRTSPLSMVLIGGYKITERLGLQAGYGFETTKEETLSVIRFGAEYGWEIGSDYELGLSLNYDRKLETYNSWFFGIVISKWLGKSTYQQE